mgnify:CR=1 FL=1
MKKFLIVIVAILIVVIGAGAVLKSKGTGILKNAAETNGSDLLGAQISLGDIALDIFKGHVAISDLAIGQPTGFGQGKSFQINNFSIDLEPLSLFKGHAKIDSIVIDKPQLNLVMIGKENNFSKLQSNLESLISDEPSSSDMKLSIKDLHLNATHLSIKSDKYGEKEVTLADVHLENIGIDEKGVSPNEVVRLTLETLKPQIAKALIELGIKDKLGAEVDKQIGEQLKDLPAPLADTLKSGIGGLFKKKKKDE